MEADEAFFTGTATEITPIRSINKKIIMNHHIKNSKSSKITYKIKKYFNKITRGKFESDKFLTYIN